MMIGPGFNNRLLYGIQPPKEEDKLPSMKKFPDPFKDDHNHPEIEERLDRIENMLKKLLEK